MFVKLVCYKATHFHSFCSITSVFAHCIEFLAYWEKCLFFNVVLPNANTTWICKQGCIGVVVDWKVKEQNKTVFRFCAPMMK